MITNSKIFCMFAVRHLLISAVLTAVFLKHDIRRSFSHPIGSADSKCRNLERATLFLFIVIAIFLQMRHLVKNNCKTGNNSTRQATPTGSEMPVTEIKSQHANHRQTLVKGLYNRPTSQLISDFITEMDAKNKAYYFILEHGHFDAFRDYCAKQSNSKLN